MVGFYSGMASSENGMLKGRGVRALVSWSVAQASIRALLRPTKVNGQPGLVGAACLVDMYCLASMGRSLCPE